jgi:hypothetical protein
VGVCVCVLMKDLGKAERGRMAIRGVCVCSSVVECRFLSVLLW